MTSLAWARPKLAELCGIDFGKCVGRSERHSIWQGGEMSQDEWAPDENVEQAIRCIPCLIGHTEIAYWPHVMRWQVSLFQAGKPEKWLPIHAEDASLPRAIVLALIAALDLKEGG